jgi:shikimate dehydrogenase
MKHWESSEMRPSGRTVVCGIVGDPVEHSMSPAMQNAAFAAAGLDWVYVAFRLRRGEAEAGSAAMKAMGIRGLNVTVPHKVDIIPFLDSIDDVARRIGAVNTIVNDGGLLTGYNTDAAGFVRALESQDVEVRDRTVVLLGAGGAGRAAAFSLADRGAGLVILNRGLARAKALAVDVAGATGATVEHGPLSAESLQHWLPSASLLVNTTSVGMSPVTDDSPCPAKFLREDLVVCDIVYNPRRTTLLRQAAERGARTVSGVEMLVWQGALAFELWTGVQAPIEIMRSAVEEELGRAAV